MAIREYLCERCGHVTTTYTEPMHSHVDCIVCGYEAKPMISQTANMGGQWAQA